MSEEKQDKLPLDARLLSDAVIELNISRRSVGLYPPEHPIIRTSIARAFEHLGKLFDIRAGITLGIAKDALVIDEYTLDRRNPVFREFAGCLHEKGIAALTFNFGLDQAELTRLHELISEQDTLFGEALVERAAKEIPHIRLSPVDYANFCFVEGARRSDTACADIWEDYVYGLLEGKLSDSDSGGFASVPPEAVADIVNSAMNEKTSQETYDRVITAYIRKKGESGMSSEAFYKFFTFIDRLKPEIKQQFLRRAGTHLSEDIVDVEAVINEMTPEGFQKIAELFTEESSHIPTTLKNLIDKLSSVKQMKTSCYDFLGNKSAVLDDIELGDDIIRLFSDDHFHLYVNKEYQKQLELMLEAKNSGTSGLDLCKDECDEGSVDRIATEIMLELLHTDFLKTEDYLTLITNLSEFMNIFLDTGRFEEILDTYNTLSAQVLSGKFKNESSGIVDYFFHSEEFIARLVNALSLWGRKDRDGAVRLARALRRSVIAPLLDALTEEQDASMRKFFLSVLEAIGSDVVPDAVRRLHDSRWFVVRNMIFLIRECNGRHEVEEVRRFIKDSNANVRIEALRTLLHFRTHDAVPYLRAFLQSGDDDIRKGAIRLAGTYRVRDAVPYLLRFLEKRDIFGTEAYYRIDIVRVLGEIGDQRAVDTLLKMYHARSIFYKGNLDELKLEIFRSLENYPPESVRKLIELGIASKNEEIHALTEKYLIAYHTYGDTGR